MLLAFGIAAAVMGAQATNTWNMGGGRSWINPPNPGSECPTSRSNCMITKRDFGIPVAMPTSQAMLYLEAAAKGGDITAMRLMGYMLLGGVGVEHDYSAAMGWFYEAAIRGDAESMYVLGRAFGDGVGVIPDSKLSAFWLKRAADNGFTQQNRP